MVGTHFARAVEVIESVGHRLRLVVKQQLLAISSSAAAQRGKHFSNGAAYVTL